MAMTFTYDTTGPMKKIIAAWTSDGSGDASGTSRKAFGHLVKAITVPDGSAAPSVDYDIALTDEQSFNILTNTDDDLTDRHTSNTEEVYFAVNDHAGTPNALALHPAVCDTITVTVSNAGDTKQGTLYLFIDGEIQPHET